MELDLLSWFGIKWSSLVAVNSGTSKRSACNSIGLSCPSVDESNTLLERTEEHMCQPLCFLFFLTSESPNFAFHAVAGPYAFACWWRRSKECGCWSSQDLAFSNFTLLGFIFSMPSTNGMEWKVLGPQFRFSEHLINRFDTLRQFQSQKINKVRRVAWWMSRYGAKSPKRQYAYANSPAILLLDVGWKKMKHTIRTCHQYVNKNGKRCWHGSSQLKRTEFLNRTYSFLGCDNLSDLFWNIRKVHMLTHWVSFARK